MNLESLPVWSPAWVLLNSEKFSLGRAFAFGQQTQYFEHQCRTHQCGVSGLITIEDVLEEIVGEIVDEYDATEGTGIKSTGPNVTEVDARVHIDDLNEQFDYGLPEEGDYDTIGGFVFTQLGRIPEPNDSFTWNLVQRLGELEPSLELGRDLIVARNDQEIVRLSLAAEQ